MTGIWLSWNWNFWNEYEYESLTSTAQKRNACETGCENLKFNLQQLLVLPPSRFFIILAAL